jgi:hypothetical protein
VLVCELRDALSAAHEDSDVLVFVKSPGAIEAHVLEVVDTADVTSEVAFVLYVEIPDRSDRVSPLRPDE